VRPQGPRERGEISAAQQVDSALVCLAVGLLGARFAYVAAHAGYFGAHLAETVAFWRGGLSWAGGAAGALIGLGAYALLTRQAFWRLADRLILPATGLACAAWLGCLLDGWAYGQPLESGWGAVPAPGLLADPVRRWPTQWLGILASLASLALLVWFAPRLGRPGALAAAGLSLLSSASLALSLLRADPVPFVRGVRLDAAGSAVLLIMALAGLLTRSFPARSA
jgi:phosphatidylglycerol:prolipoprotein diacylglycerol transferase